MSKIANNVHTLLKEVFPLVTITEEYFIFYKNQKLFVDFYIPSYLIAIEVHGQQHDRFVEHFHKDADGWNRHKQRDRLKEEWADLNNITYVVIREKNIPKTKEELLDFIRKA